MGVDVREEMSCIRGGGGEESDLSVGGPSTSAMQSDRPTGRPATGRAAVYTSRSVGISSSDDRHHAA